LWTDPKNIGSPINNHEDQFSLFITSDGKKGYYSHEEVKEAGYTSSRIFEMEIPEENRIRYTSNYVKGIVRDKQSRDPLGASVELINLDTKQTESLVMSDSISGAYLIVLTQGADYALYVNKPGYLFRSLNFNYSEVKDYQPIVLDIELERANEGTTAILENIFFDVDKFDLKEKSVTELQKILRFMRENPRVRVEISGHTDNTGSAAHNNELSEQRARAVNQYLIDKGIDQSRLIPRGYGSSHPIASNDTEEGRQKNRRIQFKIIR